MCCKSKPLVGSSNTKISLSEIDSFVNAVYLYEDKIILTFNYKDGSKTITLAEVESSDLSVLGAPKKRHP